MEKLDLNPNDLRIRTISIAVGLFIAVICALISARDFRSSDTRSETIGVPTSKMNPLVPVIAATRVLSVR